MQRPDAKIGFGKYDRNSRRHRRSFVISNSPQKRHPAAKRLTDLSRDTGLGGAQSKDLEDAHLSPAAPSFSTAEARIQRGSGTVFPRGAQALCHAYNSVRRFVTGLARFCGEFDENRTQNKVALYWAGPPGRFHASLRD